MRQEIAEKVHPVLREGLRLRDRVELGESPDFQMEQGKLKDIMLTENASRQMKDYGSDTSTDSVMSSRIGGGSGRRNTDQFMGVRYALACWLDEIIVVDLDRAFDKQWNEHKMEETLYKSNERAWQYWEQAKLAEARNGVDALEVFYLTVMLGFRGEFRGKYDQLKAWADQVGRRIAGAYAKDWSGPAELDTVTNVPPLYGRERLQRMVLAAAGFVLFLIPLLAVYLVSKLYN